MIRNHIYERDQKTQQNVRKHPSMTTPLVNHLSFDGITKHGNAILLGRAAENFDLDPTQEDICIS